MRQTDLEYPAQQMVERHEEMEQGNREQRHIESDGSRNQVHSQEVRSQPRISNKQLNDGQTHKKHSDKTQDMGSHRPEQARKNTQNKKRRPEMEKDRGPGQECKKSKG